MITNDGKNIIAKYLLNQAPEFASHIAVGVGGHALPTGSASYSASVSPVFSMNSKSLDFEAFRVPILSKGLIKELNEETQEYVEKIVFKAELPTDQRFQITEIGLFPSESNSLAERFGSKNILSFTNSEAWTYSQFGSGSVVPYVNQALDQFLDGEISPGDIVRPEVAMFINSNSSVFDYADRKNRREEPRFLDRCLMVSGDFSSLDSTFDPSSISASAGYYIENNSVRLNLGRNLPTDQIKLAMSLVSQYSSDDVYPDGSVRIIVEFINNTTNSPKAYVNIEIPANYFYDALSEQQFRYKVITRSLSDFTISSSFSWSDIDLVRIYASVEDSVDPTKFKIIFDGMRLENISTVNPLYSLIGAEYIQTDNSYPILKEENSTSYIEYRFGLGVS
jgi:hypothetical protein